MKMVKTRLRNRLGEQNLAHLMRIAIETPEKLPDDVDIWNRKSRHINVNVLMKKYPQGGGGGAQNPQGPNT